MAVYTDVSDENLGEFIAEYELGAVKSCKGITEGIENSNYLLTTEAGTFILTLYEKRVDEADLPFFLGLMDHLAANGIPCPVPIKGRDGRTLRTLCGRPTAIVTFLDGMWPRRVTADHCSELGGAMARMHLAGADFELKRENTLSVEGWRPLLEASISRADEITPDLGNILQTELDDLERNWPRDLPRGIIHADLFPDNVFFQNDRLTGLIDFYFACNDYFAYDLAICLNAWCFEADNSFNITKARRMLSAYRKVREFSDAELIAMPLLARGSALRFLLTRLYDWLHPPENALVTPQVTPKNPLEYLDKLRFHQGLSGPGAYGLD
ncbi:MAG: homoserine kinase [Rhodospirillales bacterium]|nr:homoserine kinase [Rhodospirillales bacterium]